MKRKYILKVILLFFFGILSFIPDGETNNPAAKLPNKTDPELSLNKEGYIEFNDENLLALLDMSKADWVTSIEKLGYKFTGDQDGILIYEKGRFGKTWHTTKFDYKLGMVGLLWWDLDKKQKIMETYRSSMPKTYLKTNEHVTTYSKPINGSNYIIILSNPNNVVSEEVRFGYNKK